MNKTQFDLNERMLEILQHKHKHAPEGRRLLVAGHFAHKKHGEIPEHLVLHRPPGVPVVGITETGLLVNRFNIHDGVKPITITEEIYPVDGFAQTYMYEQKDWVLADLPQYSGSGIQRNEIANGDNRI